MEGFAGAQKRTNTIRKKRPRKAEDRGGAEQKKNSVPKYRISSFVISFSDVDSVNCHTAYTDKQIHCTNQQNKVIDQIDCAKSVRPHAPAHKNGVDNRKQNKAKVA